MKVLVSCPNLQGQLSRFSLAVITLEGDGIDWVDTRAFIDPRVDLGITGIAVLPDMTLVAIQSPSRPRVVKLSNALEYWETIEVPGLKDPHGMAVMDRTILMASTGTNEILAVDVDTGRTWKHWTFHETTDRDVLHLSSIALHDGRVLVSTHNSPLPGPDRSGCGCILDVATGESLVDGLERPHSLASIGGHLHFLNSSSGGIARLGEGGRIEAGPRIEGFTRGIALAGGRLLVGASSLRLHSRKQGVTTPNEQTNEGWMTDRRYRSSIAVLDQVSFEVQRSIGFTLLAPELFDIAVLEAEPSPHVLLGNAEVLRSASQRHEIWMLRLRLERQHEHIGKLRAAMHRRRLHEKAVIRLVRFNGTTLSGVAFDPDRPDAAIHVRAAIDGRHVFYARSDLARAEPSESEVRRPRFALQIPPSVLGRARHRIEIDVPDAASCEKVILELSSVPPARAGTSTVTELNGAA